MNRRASKRKCPHAPAYSMVCHDIVSEGKTMTGFRGFVFIFSLIFFNIPRQPRCSPNSVVPTFSPKCPRVVRFTTHICKWNMFNLTRSVYIYYLNWFEWKPVTCDSTTYKSFSGYSNMYSGELICILEEANAARCGGGDEDVTTWERRGEEQITGWASRSVKHGTESMTLK